MNKFLIAGAAVVLAGLAGCETPATTAPAAPRPAATAPAAAAPAPTAAAPAAAANPNAPGPVRAVLVDRRIVILEGNRQFTVPGTGALPAVGATYTP